MDDPAERGGHVKVFNLISIVKRILSCSRNSFITSGLCPTICAFICRTCGSPISAKRKLTNLRLYVPGGTPMRHVS